VSEPRRFSDLDLNAYLDGEVSEAERAAIEQWLASDAEAARRLREYRALDQRLKGTFEFVLEEPASSALRSQFLARGRELWQVTLKQIAAAALIAVLAGGMGWLLRGAVDGRNVRTAFVDAAIGAHAVFVPEVRHPVEVAAAEEAHLVKWLTKRVGHEIKAPRLGALGFNLVGGRLLADQAIPAAQFMYEDGQGRRITLYVRREEGRGDTAFEYAGHREWQAFAWIDRPLAYALIGKVPREELQRIARATWEQLQR
jgi:anti-sigma factor RsiW